MSSNFLTSGYIEMDAFRGLSKLKKLDLSNNDLIELNYYWFKDLVSLEILDISSCKIYSLGENTFKYLKQLKSIDLALNPIHVLHANTFSTVILLEKLQFSYNQLVGEDISDEAFRGLKSLKVFSLRGNPKLIKIREKWFADLLSLEILDVSYCGIQTIEVDSFLGLRKLKFLDLSHNTYLGRLQNYWFQGLENLDILNISYCGIKSLEVYTFSKYMNLRELYLISNDIHSLHENTFKELQLLEKLDLANNELVGENISDDAFHGLRKLSFFSLRANSKLHKMCKTWFADLSSLEKLDVSHCGISTIEKDIFINNNKLNKILMSSNNLTEVFKTTFKDLSSLILLNLSSNGIEKIQKNVFSNSHKKLRYIDFSNNRLSTVSRNTGLAKLEKVSYLNLKNNTFKCTCNIVWLKHWMEETKAHIDMECLNVSSTHLQSLETIDIGKLACKKVVVIVLTCLAVATFLAIGVCLLFYMRSDVQLWIQQRRLHKQYEQFAIEGPPNADKPYDAFIAYNSKDQNWVLNVLHPALETQRNFKICVDYRDFLGGDSIANNIVNAIKNSQKVVLVVSKSFAESEWCNFELEMARMRMFDNHENILIVLLLEKVSVKDMPTLLHKTLKEKTYIRWHHKHPERQALFWTRLETALMSPNCPRDRLVNHI
ncbi:toll-like receptor 4 [Antedon mediterranea]|uniref:toll-like receptor 4 n=1 Tax=Antedon mediterranea TaxID=105859 RepID=UPI003AF66B45